MTTWHWVRHGPTHEKAFVGWRDVPADLSDTAQIERLRAHLPQDAVLISSDLIRAAHTADAIASPNHFRLPHDRQLREMNFGAWDGMHFADVADRHPDLSRKFWEFPGDFRPPDGESWNMAATRVASAVDRISLAHPKQHIIAVAHIGVILTQLQHALRITPQEAIGQKIDNLSVTQITLAPAGATVGPINHLP
ncbi:histidine phosphatase family protein [Roseobacter sp. YSTF-M11]|uniref:Histidine phosphatase family protein n=1 Tax=Roseobacter insulae TaxID=2859783 RepID=A0A9X1FRD4_9RHOB|nr:histidine phosphatase family protein [Roseobacter insulae]MBW4706247.1 histidine phosphatase family protein [Roseobacter insulae]